MIAAWWVALAGAAEVHLDRVDLLSELPGTWLHDEAPKLPFAPGVAAVRFATQITPVVSIGAAEVGLSVAAQSVGVRAALDPDHRWWLTTSVVTRAFLPLGGAVGVSVRPGPVRIGVSAVAIAGATWIRPTWTRWTVWPTIGIGIGRDPGPRAPWSEGRRYSGEETAAGRTAKEPNE
ncbi:MAG: hypothetical protein ABMB14_09625 [Myxococcota bacterium]